MSEPQEIMQADIVDGHDQLLAKQAYEVLERHYPGHAWATFADHRQGIIIVRNSMISNSWGYILHTADFVSPTDFGEKVMRAGGEVLERAKLARGRFDGEAWANLAQDSAGLPVFIKD